MNLPPFLQVRADGLHLAVRVQPRASRTEIVGVHGVELKVRVAAPPVDSAANEALVEFLAGTLQLPRRAVTLVRGASSRSKLLRVDGLAPAVAMERLQPPVK
ncbi:MAG: YggU family protein [Verrucomicrobiae bacterium]|nr:YggU family protein [Verrucomicrobiae bacterium]